MNCNDYGYIDRSEEHRLKRERLAQKEVEYMGSGGSATGTFHLYK